jgi:hypothetical protein
MLMMQKPKPICNIGTKVKVAVFLNSCPWCGYHLATNSKYLAWMKYHVQQRSRLPLTYTCPRCGHKFTAAG